MIYTTAGSTNRRHLLFLNRATKRKGHFSVQVKPGDMLRVAGMDFLSYRVKFDQKQLKKIAFLLSPLCPISCY